MKKKPLPLVRKKSATIHPLIVLVCLITILVSVLWGIRFQQQSNLADYRFLKKGMSYTEIVQKVGQPSADIGSGLHIFAYLLPDGKNLLISFADLDHLLDARVFDPQTKESVSLFE